MAVTNNGCRQGNQFEFLGTSQDSKPTEGIGVNSLFLELDTGDVYYYTGEAWSKVGVAE